MDKKKRPSKIKKVLKILGLIIISLILIGFVYEKIAEYVDLKTISPPGRIIKVNGRKIHIYCMGENKNGNPTVILEAGAGNFYTSWKKVQPELSKETRACSYDRSGLGFSDPSNRKNAKDAAIELKEILTNANIQSPYIIIAHSWGGYIARIFAQENLEDLKGIVFVDSSHEDQEKATLSFTEKIMGSVIASGFKFLANTGVIRFIFTIKPSMMSIAEPEPYDNTITRALWSTPKQQRAAIKEAMDLNSWQDVAKARNFGNMPIIVLTAQESVDGMSEWLGWQKDLSSLSANGKQIIVKNSSHYIPIDQPKIVIDATESLFSQRNKGGSSF